jgi:hypothetical protein
MTVVNNSAPRTHPNDKLRYIPKSGMSRDGPEQGLAGAGVWGRGGGETLWNRLGTRLVSELVMATR